MGWYGRLARALAERGVAVYTPDRRGAGLSEGTRAHMTSWRVVVDDLHHVAEEAARRHPGRPLHFLGISLGAVFCAAAALERPAAYRSVIAFSPGFASRIPIPFIRRLRVLRRSLTEPEKLYDLPFGVRDLTDREDWRAVLAQDELSSSQASARFLVEMFRLQRFMKKEIAGLRVPMLVLLGGGDAIIDGEAVIDMMERVERAAVRIEVLDGVPHIIPASLPLACLADRLCAWLGEEHAAAAAGRDLQRIPRQHFAPEDLPPPPEVLAPR